MGGMEGTEMRREPDCMLPSPQEWGQAPRAGERWEFLARGSGCLGAYGRSFGSPPHVIDHGSSHELDAHPRSPGPTATAGATRLGHEGGDPVLGGRARGPGYGGGARHPAAAASM